MQERCNITRVIEHLESIGAPVANHIDALLQSEIQRWTPLDNSLTGPLTTLRDFVQAGGKRLRPAFCHLAFVGAGGDTNDERIIAAGAALEMLHSFALIHDDVMDDAVHRRGKDAVHVAYMGLHKQHAMWGDSARFGEAAAILIGDMAFVYADRFMQNANPEAYEVFNEMRIELNIGQYLDIAATATQDVSLPTATKIARFKSGKYTVERPMHLGVALLGKLTTHQAAVSAYGEPVGEAFQLRDDILGAFGDPGLVGKPVGGDIREGKPTALFAIAQTRASEAASRYLAAHYGNQTATAEEIAAVQTILEETGARSDVETRIERLTQTGVAAAAQIPFDQQVRDDLIQLAYFVAGREH